MGAVKVSEIFYSIQGEGRYAGEPSIFVRTVGCNLRCKFCDTEYAFSGGERMTFEEVFERVDSFPKEASLVLTGGEPLLWEEFVRAFRLHYPQRKITIETNGTIYLPNLPAFYSISPKLSNSGAYAVRFDVLTSLIAHYDFQLKFVVGRRKDLKEVDALVKKLGVPRSTVYLMPMAASRRELHRRQWLVVKLCLERGYNFSPRLHIDIWGRRRGV